MFKTDIRAIFLSKHLQIYKKHNTQLERQK